MIFFCVSQVILPYQKHAICYQILNKISNLPRLKIFIKLIATIEFNLFIGFTEFADLRETGNHRFLYCNGYRFYRKWEQGEYTYWKCSKYSRYRCDAKITTRVIDGYTKMKVTKSTHSHKPE